MLLRQNKNDGRNFRKILFLESIAEAFSQLDEHEYALDLQTDILNKCRQFQLSYWIPVAQVSLARRHFLAEEHSAALQVLNELEIDRTSSDNRIEDYANSLLDRYCDTGKCSVSQ